MFNFENTLQISSLFSFSFSLKICSVDFVRLLTEFTCVMRTSKNEVTPADQKLPALMSKRAVKLVFDVSK